MKKVILCLAFVISTLSCFSQDASTTILLDKAILSGNGLAKISPKWADPERELFTKNAFSGQDIGINITSSSNAYHDWKNYAIDEFIFVLNGQAVVQSINGEAFTFNKGDIFIVPKGFTGRWTTRGEQGTFLEVAVYAKQRQEIKDHSLNDPFQINELDLSGIKTHKDPTVFNGAELMAMVVNQAIESTTTIESQERDYMCYILNGAATITHIDNTTTTYHTGDFYVIPKGFKGKITYNGFDNFRELMVTVSNK